jgi:hypothetical protein
MTTDVARCHEFTAGLVALHVSVKVSVEQMREWSPERIEAFFRGVAMVQAAARGEAPSEGKKDD